MTPQERALEIRRALQSSVELVTAQEWGKRRGLPAHTLDIYVQNRCCFAVTDGPDTFYPWFQFDASAYPKLEITTILTVVPPEVDGWSLLSWFEAPNYLLEGQKPSAMLMTQPERVFEAAKRFYAQD